MGEVTAKLSISIATNIRLIANVFVEFSRVILKTTDKWGEFLDKAMVHQMRASQKMRDMLDPLLGKGSGQSKGFKFPKGKEQWKAFLSGTANKGLKSLGNIGVSFGKRMVIKGLQTLKSVLMNVVNIGAGPVMGAISQTLESLGKILNVVLIPLKPFLFLLELIGKVLEAALAPLQIYIWEEFADVFGELVAIIPELQDMVREWIENDLDLKETIDGIISGVMGLIDAFVNGDLLRKIYNLSVNLLTLAGTLVTTQDDGRTLLEQFIDLASAIGRLAVQLTKLLPILEWIIDVITGLVGAVTPALGGEGGLAGSLGWMALLGPLGIVPMLLGGLFGAIPSAQEGGSVTEGGLVNIHAGEVIESEGGQEEIIKLLGEIVYLQNKILEEKKEKYR